MHAIIILEFVSRTDKLAWLDDDFIKVQIEQGSIRLECRMGRCLECYYQSVHARID
jgi:hypothetical protein